MGGRVWAARGTVALGVLPSAQRAMSERGLAGP